METNKQKFCDFCLQEKNSKWEDERNIHCMIVPSPLRSSSSKRHIYERKNEPILSFYFMFIIIFFITSKDKKRKKKWNDVNQEIIQFS